MDLLSLISTNFPRLPAGYRHIHNLTGSSAALLLALESGPFIAVEKDEENARILSSDIRFYRRLLHGDEVLFLPEPDGPAGAGDRARIIHFLKDTDSIVTTSKNLDSSLYDRESLQTCLIHLKKGLEMDRELLEEMLVLTGYTKAPMAVEKGEYSQRGWITDIFPSTSDDPLRIEFFGDEIEQLKKFDVETQRSTEDIDEFLIFPAAEPDGTRRLSGIIPERKYYSLRPPGEIRDLPDNTVFLSRYSFDLGYPAAGDEEASSTGRVDAGMFSIKGLGILPEERKTLDDLPGSIGKLGKQNRVIIIASSEGQAERLNDIFRENDLIVPRVDINDLPAFKTGISISSDRLSTGLFMDGLIILTEKEIFGRRSSFRPIKKSRISNLLLSLDDITPGDFVVHRDHGIGRFSGIDRQEVDGTGLELMTIEYEGGRLHLPVNNIHMISKYRSREGIIPKIDMLGGKSWRKKKTRAGKKVHELASKLISLYADRTTTSGFSFSPDTELHREFDSFFEYEETPDQLKAVEEIKKAMENDRPMDRLLCGDVGYGKTEVAMRAAFKAIYDNRQVAVLVPTTILAEQHYRTFRERFSGFPVKIDVISRFKSKKEINATLKALSNGEVDIIIGTHGLLSKRVAYSRLGMLIVDEEHRFGVAQKERIKELTKNIDVLNLTATPLPRTMHMALSGIRDISVIETPPEERLAVKSIVTTFEDSLIKDIIEKELLRNGQVFFIHNRILDIEKIAARVRKLAPGAEIGVAHGRMQEKDLDRVMHRFFEGEIDVLVSTAIVGSGLDIGGANTIIINMAEKMGLADLYQLRGRVGRSNIKAYAYFLAPGESMLTEIAKKRLQAIQEMSYLGAGFRLAMRDLGIRGAGNIFGPEQSGHISEIGFDLYIEMLRNAVDELRGIEHKEEPDPVIELKTSALIPVEYIEDITLRLSFYRRIASMEKADDIDELMSELEDRFGMPPEEVINLMEIMRLKILARELMIKGVRETQGKIQVIFSPNAKVRPENILALYKSRSRMIKFLPEGFEIRPKELEGRKRFEKIYGVINELKETCFDEGNGLHVNISG
ncbi:MAG: transcription-repair coupling factor [Nitrospirota bacterium]|nr:transcription-repair coupling factor [Nitrospirota bacterium]